MIKTFNKGENKKISQHFNISEFHCHGQGCCSVTKNSTKLIKLCEKMRNHFGKAITINSGYRCKKHNSDVGGNVNSSHLKGKAADIYVADGSVSAVEMAKYAESIGIKRIGLYDNWIHIGSNNSKLFWKNSTYGLDSFGGNTYNRPTRVIKADCTGDDVKWVQYWLKDKGFNCGNIDGYCGEKTVKAINQFRLENGWKANGKIKSVAKKVLEK